MRINFSAPITAADAETRTLTGTIVPFGATGNTSAGPVIFEAGSFLGLKAEGIKLLLEHDSTAPVGRALEFTVNPGGIVGKFRIAETTRGNDLLVEAADGLRDGFSVGAMIHDFDVVDGVMRVAKAELIEVSAVAYPAFTDARITDVAASEQTSDEIVEEPQQEEEQVEPTTAPAVELPAEPVVEAAAAPASPVYTTPRIAGMSSGDYVAHSVKAAMGDRDSAILVQAADDSTTTNTGLTLPNHLSSFLTTTFATRPTIDACGGAKPLPFASGMSYTLPKLTVAPTVAEKGEGVAPSETGMESDYLTVDIKKYSGLNRVSFELLDRSAPFFGDLLLNELQKAYAKATDTAVIAALTAGGTQATATAATVAGLQSFIATEGPAAYVATGGDFATELIGSSAWWTELLSASDLDGRPIFSALVPSNAGGSVAVDRARGTVFGTNFHVDHNIATAGLIDESAFLVAKDSVHIAESPTTQLRVNVLTTGEVEINLYGYMAVKVLKAGGVRRFNKS